MYVSKNIFHSIIKSFSNAPYIVLDTETTGLNWTKDHVFAIAIATNKNIYYFDFNNYLPREWIKDILYNFNKRIIGHNIKFDALMLLKEGLNLNEHDLYDTLIAERVIYNDHKNYGLDALTGNKLDIKKYLDEYKLYTIIHSKYKSKREKLYHYDRAPLDIIQPYTENDVLITRQLYLDQQSKIRPEFREVLDNELKLIKVLIDMERIGVTIDINYVNKAIEYYTSVAESCEKQFKEITGMSNINGKKSLSNYLLSKGIIPETTEKGNNKLDKFALEKIDAPAIKLLLEYRDAEKRVQFLGSYLELSDLNNKIHCSFKQAGANTGRMSCSSPNLQQVNKNKDVNTPYPIRQCFMSRNDYVFVTIDYDNMEMKLVYDLSESEGICKKINEGLDCHQAAADETGLTRSHAKTLNFSILYGSGKKNVSEKLKMSISDTKKIMEEYFKKAPKLATFIKKVSTIAGMEGYIYNSFGRKYYFDNSPTKDALSKIIQGGCADIVKFAMVECHNYLKSYKSNLILQVHDELFFEIHKSELFLIEKLKLIMESVYKGKLLNLTCSYNIYEKYWGKKNNT